jgi:hypothetical protein
VARYQGGGARTSDCLRPARSGLCGATPCRPDLAAVNKVSEPDSIGAFLVSRPGGVVFRQLLKDLLNFSFLLVVHGTIILRIHS